MKDFDVSLDYNLDVTTSVLTEIVLVKFIGSQEKQKDMKVRG